MSDRERETLLRQDHERAVREQKGVVIVFVICFGIVVLFSHFAPSDQTQSIQQATAAYVVDFATPMVDATTQSPVDYGLLPPESTPEPSSPFSPEVLQWSGKADEWSQVHSEGRVPQDFILSIIEVESGGDPNAGYPDSESLGLFQIWDQHLIPGGRCAGVNPFDPDQAASCAIPLMDEAIASATRDGHPNYIAAAVGYHLPGAIPWALGEESPEHFIARMYALGHNGDNLLASATLFRERVQPFLEAVDLR